MTTVTVRPNKNRGKVTPSLISAVDKKCTDVANDAFEAAPKDTGYMASTIDVVNAQREGLVVTGGVVVAAEYAKYVEVDQPFLGPALRSNRDDIASEIIKAIKDALSGR